MVFSPGETPLGMAAKVEADATAMDVERMQRSWPSLGSIFVNGLLRAVALGASAKLVQEGQEEILRRKGEVEIFVNCTVGFCTCGTFKLISCCRCMGYGSILILLQA